MYVEGKVPFTPVLAALNSQDALGPSRPLAASTSLVLPIFLFPVL